MNEPTPSPALPDLTQPADGARSLLTKVPEVTIFFWIIKVMTTGVGETISDYLAHRLGPMPAVALAAGGLVVTLALQYAMRRYVAWVYWLVVLMVSVFGTMAADVLHVGLGIPYVVSTAFYAVALMVVFATWYATEKTLSVHSIDTPRRETFYWAAVLTTFALGTAAGDLTAITMHLGYLSSGVLFAVLIAVPALAFWRFGQNPILSFWFAYVVTRPLGASIADWIAVPSSRAGLGLGTGPVSLLLTIAIVCFVGYPSVSRQETEGEPT